jgi:hypothetical protein
MLITDFEKKIKDEIHPDLSIRINPNADDIAGVYLNNTYMGIALPPQEIRDEFNPKYADHRGSPYRSIQQALDLINGKLTKFQDPEVIRVMNEKL